MDLKVEDEDIQYLYGEQEHNQDICPYCRREIDRSFVFCPYCGKEIGEENRS